MPRILAALLAAVLLMSGCAYVGSPLPPLANIPMPVTNLAAVQRGSRLIVHFTVPTQTTESFPVKMPLKLDLRIGPAGTAPDQFRLVPATAPDADGLATFDIPTSDWTGQTISIAARVTGPNNRSSDWVQFTDLPVVAPPPQPASFRAASAADGVRLTWEGPAGDFRVFRRAGEDKSFPRVADVQANVWTDPATEAGKPYTYIVQRIVKLAGGREAESDPSPEFGLTATDTFAPAPPAGLRASGAPDSVELSWERNTEADLAAYRLYRAAGNGAFERIAEVPQIPSYSDRAIEHGKTYRYAITAIDQSGNESAQSAAVEVAIP